MTPAPGDRGAALLSVLLLVAVMAVIAATALDRLTLATRIAGSAATVDQGRAYSFAAEQIALGRVADLVGRDPAKLTLAGDWLGRDFVLPLPGGEGRARLTDASNCFNLNSLVAETLPGRLTQRMGAQRQFAALMTLLGIEDGEAQAIAGAAADWIDSDSNEGRLGAEDNVYRSLPGAYLPANRKMAHVSELRAVRGVSAKLYAQLEPWVCVLPTTDPVKLNVNTLAAWQAPLVAMLWPGEIDVRAARAALAARPAGGYGSSVRFWEASAFDRRKPPDDVAEQAAVTSRWLVLTTNVTMGDGFLTAVSLIDANGGAPSVGTAPPVIVRRDWGESD
ncbi:type II secretion system minor pseudopilin GspK [Sphingopyxis alaskensis]|jgi:general secretion pathway protein K|uniref:Type II secretion system protein K n=1 Tax=Sphingopyxis alaskensis (strain DSM 13593 / LMG 18877 / RB2256) TaxID=317655 RepID=Q1GWC7_SPHAL|nr:type II secretion system minor pseudopilin GspK [Sphingopyxis alaskensis]ABF52045.1 General secretion pathway protein K [Sphingopyxis alaskensis RB2256]MCM3419263.1 type II secretion system minor pseudopilin GspK [Sphingopyxis alaskensis]